MILASGARGPEFDSRNAPTVYLLFLLSFHIRLPEIRLSTSLHAPIRLTELTEYSLRDLYMPASET